ncbi:MAG TPA: hypothetical protein VMG81_00355 [Thermoplasmata archaeon]|nr:hypothetical protein [Thermoplasmata archaeon]
MTRAPWTLVEADRFDAGRADRALAYWSPDGRFALYNDYRTGQSFLVSDPGPIPDQGPPSWWARGAGPARPFSLADPAPVEGYGVFTFPYGPVSLGVAESGRFDLRTYGERILAVTPIGGFKSRRLRAGLAGLSLADAGLRIERTVGNFAAAHVAAFLAAAESAVGAEVPLEELWVRAFAQELQRIYNHLHVIARIAEAANQNVGSAQAHALAEEMVRFQGRVFGHRWLFGALLPGGPARRLGSEDRRAIPGFLTGHEQAFDRLWSLFLESRTFIDRIQATAPVPRDRAVRLGGVGPTLRASGVAWDDRLRVPHAPYTDLFLTLPQESAGDALARVLVRVQEIRASFSLLEQLLERWPSNGAVGTPDPPIAPGRGLARVEAPSGDLVYDVTVRAGRVDQVGVRTASQANFPLLAEGLRDQVFTDFHFAYESFGLVFAETDG